MNTSWPWHLSASLLSGPKYSSYHLCRLLGQIGWHASTFESGISRLCLQIYFCINNSKTWADHLRHLRAVLAELHRHALFVKRSKCIFGSPSAAYLGHIISAHGVAMDPTKVQAIHDWLAPRSACVVRGFLGLARYYQIRPRLRQDRGTTHCLAEEGRLFLE